MTKEKEALEIKRVETEKAKAEAKKAKEERKIAQIEAKREKIRIKEEKKKREEEKKREEKKKREERKIEGEYTFREILGEIIWRQPSFKVWFGVAVTIFLIFFLIGSLFSYLGGIIIGAITGIMVGFWFKKCLIRVGTIEMPSQAVFARFGRAIDVKGPGLYFLLRPIEKFKEYPMQEYLIWYIVEDIYTLESEKISSQKIEEAEISVYLRFPKFDRDYTFWGRDRETGKFKKTRVSGKELLMRETYYRLPVRDLTTSDGLVKFLEKGTKGALRDILARKTHIECRQNKQEIEKEMKEYLLNEEGNPYYEIGIPKECLDIELVRIRFSEDFEKALRGVEIASKKKEAKFQDIKAEKERIEKIVKAAIEASKEGDPRIAQIMAMLGQGVEGRPLDMGQVRDALFTVVLLNFMGGERRITGGERRTTEDLKRIIQEMTPEDIKKLFKK